MKQLPTEQDKILKDIASRYAEAYGEKLTDENNELVARPDQKEGIAEESVLRAEEKTRKAIRAVNRRKWYGTGIAIAAACLLLLFIPVSQLFDMPHLLGDNADTGLEPGGQGGVHSEYARIPLLAELPDSLSISAVEEDREKTVYHLENTDLDHIIMTLQKVEAGYWEQDFDNMEKMLINGFSVRAWSLPEYKVIVFEKDDILYTLTCRYEMDTLTTLAKSIL